MASKKIYQPINSMSSIASKNRRKGSLPSNPCTVMASLMQVALLQHIMVFLLTMPISLSDSRPLPGTLSPSTEVSITNNHSKILTVRCFTFHDESSPATARMHLKTNETYSFTVTPNGFYPSTTMYNCSTNMGVFVAYRYDYNCSRSVTQTNGCEWMFDENQTYYKNDLGTWESLDYNPNYESLGRGGVVKGYFTN